MFRRLKWKIVLVVLVSGLALHLSLPLQEKINLGLDLQGGMHLGLQIDTSQLSEEEKKGVLERVLTIVRNRIDQFGVSEPSIQTQGKDRIIVQLPGVTERERAIELLGKTALLEFKLVDSDPDKLKAALEGNVPQGYELKYSSLPIKYKKAQLKGEPLLLVKSASLTGKYLIDANMRFDQNRFNQPVVALQFNKEGSEQFAKITTDNVGKRLAIVLDGEIQSAPLIREPIPNGEAVISGDFSQSEAGDLAVILRAGALPAPIHIEEERTVGPSLGKDSISQGIKATLWGGIVVVLFMAIYYLLAGLIANFALFLNLILILGALSYFKATLTLPGIAGIILTIGMAVDANVLIFERIREEIKNGRSLRTAISAGYKRAFLTIVDANLTTLITALILFRFGSGPVRGFAITLSIGIIASMFTSLFCTRIVFDILSWSKKFQKLPMFQLIKNSKIDFIGKRKIAYFLSSVVIIIGLIFFIGRGEKNFGIDFTGGSLQQFRFQKAITPQNLRTSLEKIGLKPQIQQFGGEKEILVKSDYNVSNRILEQFQSEFSVANPKRVRIERVGPAVGRDFKKQALFALLFSMLAICAYISWRFEFRFAVAAIVAIFHDVLLTTGILSLTGREISLPIIAALLTIVGYSLNDTIVVFDRIREDRRLIKKGKLETIINLSINQTLSRTLLTSLTTFIVVFCLFIFGGEVIHNFAFTLLIGIIVGTYSSIFVASPILVDWKR